MDKPKLSKVPLPTDTETLEQFIATELNDPAYKGLTVEDILKGDEFKGNDGVVYDISNIREAEKLMSFLKEKKAEPKPTAEQSEEKAPEQTEKVDKSKVEAMPSIKPPELVVVEDPNIAEQVDDSESKAADNKPPSKIASQFMPSFRILQEKLSADVSFTSQDGFTYLASDGLGSMRNATSVLKTHRKYAIIEQFMQSFNPAAIVADEVKGSDDYVNPGIHGYVPSALMHQRTAVQEQELSTSPAVDVNAYGDRATIVPQDIEDFLKSDRNGDEPIFSVSLEDLGTIISPTLDGEVKSSLDVQIARVMMNPYRIALLQRSLKATKYMKIPQSLLLDEQDGLPLNPYMRQLLKSRNLSEMDVYSDEELQLHVFDRPFTDDPKAVFKYLRDKTFDAPELAMSQQERSTAIAASHAAVLTSNANRVVPHGSTRNIPESTLSALQRIMPGHASDYMQKLSAHLLGGLNQELLLDFTDVHESEQDSLIPLASAANMMLLDKRFLDETAIYTLVLGLIQPYYDSYTTNENESAQEMALKIARDGWFESYPNGLRRPSQQKLGRNALRTRNPAGEVQVRLNNILNLFFGNAMHYERQNSKSMVYDLDQPDTYIPFPIGDDDMFKIIAFGEGEGHSVLKYADYVDRRVDALKELAKVMEYKSTTGNIYEKLSAAIDPATHVYYGCASVVDMMTKAMASSTDLMPAQFRANNMIRRLHGNEPTKLPFLGALSFFYYGVSSSALPEADISGDLLPYLRMREFPLLSGYAFYRYIEHAMTRYVYRNLDFANDLKMRSEDINKLVDIVDDAMRVFYTSTEGDSKRRIKYLLQHAQRYLIDVENPPELPESFLRKPLADARIKAANSISEEPENGVLFGQSFAKDGVLSNPELDTYNIFERSRQTIDQVINKFYIDVNDSISPMMYYDNEYGRKMVYVADTLPTDDIMTLEQLVNSTENLQERDSLDLGTIQHLAKKHPEKPSYIEVTVHDCPVKFIKQEGFTDTIAESLTLKISLKKEYFKRKYTLDYFPVYYKLNNDKRAVDVRGNELLGMENKTFHVPYFIDVSILQKMLIHFSMMRMNKPKAFADNFRIRDGAGMTYVAPVDVAVRKSESLMTHTSLTFK